MSRHGAAAWVFADPHERDRRHLAKPKPRPQWRLLSSSRMRREWWHVIARDKRRCRYCGTGVELTFDHVRPVSQGGPTTYANLVLACWACSQRKGARTPEQAAMPLLEVRQA